MRILIACEYSGRVREAFAKKGHEVLSCDILPTDIPGNHYQGDVLPLLNQGWDMLIGFPPCTFLTVAANKYLSQPGRLEEREKASEFFKALYFAPIKKICIENPAGYMNHNFIRPTQTIHPYFFGESVMKRTCLWLRNLPPLFHTGTPDLFSEATHTKMPEPLYIRKNGNRMNFIEAIRPGPDRAKRRSLTFNSIAEAMANQWG
jgi:hypothetical protein